MYKNCDEIYQGKVFSWNLIKEYRKPFIGIFALLIGKIFHIYK